MTNKKFYVTTAIDYVNAKPHIGHAFEKVIADALIRWRKVRGDETFFLTGTDENAQKNAQAAKAIGKDPQEFVDENSKFFVELCEKLGAKYDRFIRTTEDEHKEKSKEIFKIVADKGEIYKGKYEGHYCQGCESFITEKELVDGKCPEHDKEPEWLSEDAYFFKLGKYKDELIEFVENYIVPKSKKNEILSRLKNEDLRDLCVSRSGLDWGIDSPIDKDYKIYVWFDALINYISGSNGNWPADVHIIGKGINWFHSVIWSAMLMSAEIELPKKLMVHGYLNVGGKKISKSLGNTIDPLTLLEKYPSDSVRYSLLRCSMFEDSDYSEDILIERHNNELANKLGNLVSRISGLIEKNGIEKCRNTLWEDFNVDKVIAHLDDFELDKALSEIFGFIDRCNEYVQDKKPWETGDKKVLYELADSIKVISVLLWPYIPETSEKIAERFGFSVGENSLKQLETGLDDSVKVSKGEILFNKIEE